MNDYRRRHEHEVTEHAKDLAALREAEEAADIARKEVSRLLVGAGSWSSKFRVCDVLLSCGAMYKCAWYFALREAKEASDIARKEVARLLVGSGG